MSVKHTRRAIVLAASIALVGAALGAIPAVSAQAYAPTGGIMYQLGSDPCLKGRGNCAVYPKAVALPSGRLVAAFEKSTVVASSGGATGQTLPIYTSDDDGATWQARSQVAAPASLSSDPSVAKYTSNWTNPYLYVMPQTVGSLRAGTLVLASVVSGEDAYYMEHKAADPTWVPNNDGDRRDVAIALFSSTDEGVTWNFVNVIAAGGWQGGSAGAIGTNIAAANTAAEVDPVWEPYLLAYNGSLIAWYSDENDYTGVNTSTGVPTLDPANATAADSHGQILAHRTWNGVTTSSWSAPVADVTGLTQNNGGKSEIGGGRPGMANVVQTVDGKWMLSYEYWGGGTNTRYKLASSPLAFWSDGSASGTGLDTLPVTSGSHTLASGGSPVLIAAPDGRLFYNASGSGDVWVNQSGLSTGAWTEYQTSLGSGYSRNLTYIPNTGNVEILQGTWGGATGSSILRYADVDFGHSTGTYYRLVNRMTGQVIGTGNKSNDANLGNADVPDVVSEPAGSASNADTEYWHVTTKPGGAVQLLNKSGGRAAEVWTGTATAGQKVGQWVDNMAGGTWNLVASATSGYYTLQAASNTSLYLSGATAGAQLTLQTASGDGSQDWALVAQTVPTAGYEKLTNRNSGMCLDVNAASTADGANVQQWTCNGGTNQAWQVQAVGSTFVQLVNRNSGKCLDVSGSSLSNGGNVDQLGCTGLANQLWQVQSVGSGYVQLVNRNSGLCLDVNAFSTSNGGNVQQWACTGGSNQQWVRAAA
ncbi:RICIN domain-containing protein [Galbitalea soli]|uniref:RICIN domain-containing protein n=1 Tax=Galbitalea soli TaxID=1268042 RepID=UPI0017FFBFDC|nr:hypothetical protein [Galbitalea soli]